MKLTIYILLNVVRKNMLEVKEVFFYICIFLKLRIINLYIIRKYQNRHQKMFGDVIVNNVDITNAWGKKGFLWCI